MFSYLQIAAFFVVLLQIANAQDNSTCGENEEWVDCLEPCPANCQMPNPPHCINIWCQPGCQCISSTIREAANGKCIPPTECKDKCGKNQVFDDCGTACPETCSMRNPPCTDNCVMGCFCDSGYIMASVFGECIPVDDCIV